jgi:uncharacterized membrane protein
MVEFIFGMMESIGFAHPLHPALTHLPMGMVMGAITFGLAAFVLKQPGLYRTAYHASVLGFLGTPVAAFLGYLDWQRFYGGEYSFQIKVKLALALILFILLGLAIIFGKDGEKRPFRLLAVYGLCLLTAIGLGFMGGELIFG